MTNYAASIKYIAWGDEVESEMDYSIIFDRERVNRLIEKEKELEEMEARLRKREEALEKQKAQREMKERAILDRKEAELSEKKRELDEKARILAQEEEAALIQGAQQQIKAMAMSSIVSVEKRDDAVMSDSEEEDSVMGDSEEEDSVMGDSEEEEEEDGVDIVLTKDAPPAHVPRPQRVDIVRWRSTLCKNNDIGTCAYGENCAFAHGRENLIPSLCRLVDKCTNPSCQKRHKVIPDTLKSHITDLEIEEQLSKFRAVDGPSCMKQLEKSMSRLTITYAPTQKRRRESQTLCMHQSRCRYKCCPFIHVK
jgi:hypothetical protein